MKYDNQCQWLIVVSGGVILLGKGDGVRVIATVVVADSESSTDKQQEKIS